MQNNISANFSKFRPQNLKNSFAYLDILHINIVAFYPAVLRDVAKFEKIISKAPTVFAKGLMSLKISRLTKDKDFDQIFKCGRSYYSPSFGLKILPSQTETSRLGIVISRKVSKKARERNQLKRRIREFFRLEIGKLKPGYDFLVIVLPGATNKKYQEMAALLRQSLDRLKLLK